MITFNDPHLLLSHECHKRKRHAVSFWQRSL